MISKESNGEINTQALLTPFKNNPILKVLLSESYIQLNNLLVKVKSTLHKK